MCDILLKKSEENKNIADELYKKKDKCNISFIHCSYYSLFQLIKYIVTKKLNLDENSVMQQFKNGTHKTYIKLILKETRKTFKEKADELQTAILEIRQLRNDCDYGLNYYPEYSDYTKVYLKSDMARKILNEYLKK